MKLSLFTISLAMTLFVATAADVPSIEKQVADSARQLDLLIKPEKGGVVIGGPGGVGRQGRTKPLDSKKVAPIVAEDLKIPTDVVLDALKTRKASEIIFAKFISDAKKSSLKELLDHKDQVFSLESLRAAGVPMNTVKEKLEQTYTDLAFISLDELK